LNAIEAAKSVAKIDLADLLLDDIGAFIADTLNLQVEAATSLTEVVYNKTEGNIFFAMQVLEELRRKDLLRMSETVSRWVWDVEQIVLLSGISSDAVEAVMSKIQSLSEKQQRMLSIAAFMRFNFTYP
jgi:predicted ATPase